MPEILTRNSLRLAESRSLPDGIVRAGIRLASKRRLKQLRSKNESSEQFLARMQRLPVAIETAAANSQHYELPSTFFELVLGSNRKYSACFWDGQTKTLDQAEEKTLAIYLEELQPKPNESILELGCGWGSLTLYLAANLPDNRIVGVSNSSSQRDYILDRAKALGIRNVEVLTCDINKFHPESKFDRIVSIEMFEHVRNHSQLFDRMSNWINPNGRLLVHVFSHQTLPYTFEVEGSDNWMGKYFFTGGMMPSHDLLPRAAEGWKLIKDQRFSGTNYEKTSNAWLQNLDKNESEVLNVLKSHYSQDQADLWLQRWRMFFMACAELFGYSNGNEWGVSLFTFVKKDG